MALAAAVARKKPTTMRYFSKVRKRFLDKEYINAYNISRRAAQKKLLKHQRGRQNFELKKKI